MLNKVLSTYRSSFRVIDSKEDPSTGVKIPIIRGAASHSDVRSQKGYRYRSGFWDKIINDSQLQQRVEGRDMLGMIEHPLDDSEYMRTPLNKASHIVLRAWVDDASHDPYIDCGLLNNEDGCAIKALVDVGFRPGCSTRALGDYLEDSISEYLDENNYYVITWDLVRSPNFEDIRLEKVSDSLMASPLFREAVQMYQLRDSVDDAYNPDHLLADISKAISDLERLKDRVSRSLGVR